MSAQPDTLVQRLAHVLIDALDLDPALAVLIAFAVAGAVALGVVAGVLHALSRFTLTPKE